MTETARPLYLIAAFASGGLLAIMLLCNGTLAQGTSAQFSSLAAHGTGTVAAALILALGPGCGAASRGGAPLWAFLGGLSGAVTVILTSIAMASSLALAGTLALGLAGQAVFGLIADRVGLFGLPVRKPGAREFAALALILAGSGLIIAGGAP